MSNKSISVGYKVFAIFNHGYNMNWRFHSKAKGISDMSSTYWDSSWISGPTTRAVSQLDVPSLSYRNGGPVLYTDNLFDTVELCFTVGGVSPVPL